MSFLSNLFKKKIDRVRKGWLLEGIPSYDGKNVLAKGAYECGIAFFNNKNDSRVMMQIVTETNLDQFRAYGDKLIAKGYVEEYTRNVDNNEFKCFSGEAGRVFVSYFGNLGRVQILLDKISVSEKEFSYSFESENTADTKFYMYGLHMDPNGVNPQKPLDWTGPISGLPNGGAFLFIKCADGSLIWVDGGHSPQIKPEEYDALDELFHNVAGKEQGEKVRISCWYFTHPHGDHFTGIYRFLKEKKDTYVVERILSNFHSPESFSKSYGNALQTDVPAFITENYPDCIEIKMHTGQQVQIANVKLGAYFSQEEHIDPETMAPATRDSNDTSLIIIADGGDVKMAFLGDTSTASDKIIDTIYGEESLKCDIVQAAHHNFNYLPTMYRKIGAQIAVYPQTEGGVRKNDFCKKNFVPVKENCKEIYFSGNPSLTVGFSRIDGELKKLD